MAWRAGVDSNMTPVQQALTVDSREYDHYKMQTLMLGVVLDVYPSDDPRNMSASQSETRRGFLPEAKVLLVGTNTSSNLIVDHAAITQPHPAGLDNYFEQLPRPSKNRFDGEPMDPTGAYVDPFDLDGDWCIVGFLGGNMDQPFILTWWPHPKNGYDAATSGKGNPTQSGDTQALDQDGRYFHRVNGIEFVVTPKGDLYLSTNYASSILKFPQDQTDTRGRWARSVNPDIGGSILVELKPTQSFELSFDSPIDGAGIFRGNDAAIPQTNPPASQGNATTIARENTYIVFDKDEIKLDAPEEVRLSSRTRIRLSCDDETIIQSATMLTLESPIILLGENAETGQGAVRGFDLFNWLLTAKVVTATGPAFIDIADLVGPDQDFIANVVSTKTIVE